MKYVTCLFYAIFIFYKAIIAQNAIIDSLHQSLRKERSDSGKAIILYNLSYYYQRYKPDSALLLAREAYTISKKSNFIRGQASSLAQMANAYNNLGNYSSALENYIDQLKIVENKNDPEGIATVNLNIALTYDNEKDFPKALFYARKADSIIEKNNLSELYMYSLLNMGDIFINANQLDSAFAYTFHCYLLSVKQRNDLITGTALNNMGNIYLKMGKFILAINSYKSSIPYFESQQDYNTLAECELGMAKSYEKIIKIDSAFYYGKKSFNMARENEFLSHAVNASAFLSTLYRKVNNIDSAYWYQNVLLSLKDSLDNHERIKQLQSLTLSEQIRQKELEEHRIAQSKERRETLELLGIGIFIPICFLGSIFISRKRVNKKIITFTGIFSILLLFEYITLLIHPFVADKTNHSPLLEILIFVTIAAFLTPAHHRIEKWLGSKLAKIHSIHLEMKAGTSKTKENP